MNKLVLSLAVSIGLIGCTQHQNGDETYSLYTVAASAQTDAVQSNDDAADDAVVWYNKLSPKDTLVIGTNKRWGLEIYDLSGKRVEQLEVGRVNNVDLRSTQSGQFDAMAAASNRTHKSISLFGISEKGDISLINDTATGLNDPYGLCMGKVGEVTYVFVNDKDGRYQQWALNSDNSLTNVREWVLPAQPEGCAVDDSTGTLYFGIEEMGVYRMSARADQAATWHEIDRVGQGMVVADVEGVDIYRDGERSWLMVSSQGDNSYAIYDMASNYAPVARIRVGEHEGIDGTEETDGIAVLSIPVPGFSKGLWVIQDGFNTSPKQNQNFKYVSMQDVIDLITTKSN